MNFKIFHESLNLTIAIIGVCMLVKGLFMGLGDNSAIKGVAFIFTIFFNIYSYKKLKSEV